MCSSEITLGAALSQVEPRNGVNSCAVFRDARLSKH